MIPRWTKLPCTECSREELATRADEKPDSYAATFLCEACESHKEGYEEGLKEGSKARNWIGECYLRLQKAGWDEAPTYLPDVITRLLRTQREDKGIIAKLHQGFKKSDSALLLKERRYTHVMLEELVKKNNGGCPDCGSPDPEEHATGCHLANYDWEGQKWKEVP